MLLTIPALLPLVAGAGAALQWPFGSPSADPTLSTDSRVNVTLYVMSRCPDARICENVFEEVLSTKGILDKIQLDIGYIGTTNSSAPGGLGVTCKHGELECRGNAHQLCLFHHLAPEDFYANVACHNYQDFPGRIGTLGLTRQCARATKVDWEGSGVGRCIEGKGGSKGVGAEAEEEKLGKEARKLLRDDVRRTEERGITTSCTVVIGSTLVKAGERTCVVDGGVWKGCDDGHAASDFVRVIEAEYKNLVSPKTATAGEDELSA